MGRSGSFAAYGSLERELCRPALRRMSSCGALLASLGAAAEPVTPAKRGLTTDALADLQRSLLLEGGALEAVGSADAGFERQASDDTYFDFDDLPPLPQSLSAPLPESRKSSLLEPSAEGGYGDGAASPQRPPPSPPLPSPSSGLPRPAQRRNSSAPARPRLGGLRIAILANGSDGDLVPLLALGENLRDVHHHTVRAFTTANLVGRSADRGIDAVPVFADTRATMRSMGGVGGTFLDSLGDFRAACRAWLRANPGVCVAVEDALKEFQPHAVIAGSAAGGPALRHEHEECVPAIPVWLQRETLELFEDQLLVEPSRPQFFAVSSILDPDPLPKARRLHRTAAWALADESPPRELEGPGCLAALRRFLAAGPAPVVVGWGSMIARGLPPGQMLRLALGALHRTGRRAVVLGGWAGLHEAGHTLDVDAVAGDLSAFVEEQACFVPFAPHDWLFPQCSCAIHHGGAGTAHAALRAGLPAVVTPIFADQFSTARAINRLGAGYGFEEELPKITQEQLMHALRTAEECGARARELSRQLEQEKGVKYAGAIVDSFLQQEVKTGKWAQKAQKAHAQTQKPLALH